MYINQKSFLNMKQINNYWLSYWRWSPFLLVGLMVITR